MMKATAALISRVDRTLSESSGRFPMYADPVTGTWTWSEEGGWFGGFWPGLLWLAAAATGESRYARAAAEASERLTARAEAPTVLRGFLHWYGAALGCVLGRADGAAAETACTAARSLAADVDPVTGLLPPGEEDAERYDWPRPGACVDSLPGVVPLLVFAADRLGDPGLLDAARSHARGLYGMCVREDGSVAQTATYGPTGALRTRATVNGSSPASTWARAQAWAMLGLTQAAHFWPEFVGPAARVADWWLEHAPAGSVSFWDFDDPAIPAAPPDSSAAAIAAAALAQLAPLTGGRHAEAASALLTTLATRHLGDHGGLVDGCYNLRKGVAVHHELVWGDYFLLEAALTVTGAVPGAATLPRRPE